MFQGNHTNTARKPTSIMCLAAWNFLRPKKRWRLTSVIRELKFLTQGTPALASLACHRFWIQNVDKIFIYLKSNTLPLSVSIWKLIWLFIVCGRPGLHCCTKWVLSFIYLKNLYKQTSTSILGMASTFHWNANHPHSSLIQETNLIWNTKIFLTLHITY